MNHDENESPEYIVKLLIRKLTGNFHIERIIHAYKTMMKTNNFVYSKTTYDEN